jgi:signal transduction histidine kinase
VAVEDGVSILLVDDQPANLGALEATLESTGCRFVLARSADEALLALLDQDFAAIVLDIRMPGMSGLELAEMIRRRQRTRHVPILFLTAHMLDEQDVLQGYAAGAVDYLTKPINAEILRSKIAVFVDLYRNRRSLSRLNITLQREIAERQRVEEALRKANVELESRVQERTAALREADRRKDEFLASLAHELRNPLAALRAAAERLRRKIQAGSELEKAAGVIDRQLRHLTRLTDDLVDINRITRDKMTLKRERIDLKQVVTAAVETIRPVIEQQGHTLALHMPPGPVWLDADFVRLAQVFGNLLDNAAKYTDSGGDIRLSVELAGSEVLVIVKDNGPGIERDVLPRVFDLFAQGDRPHPHAGGLGIGLALVRRLVQMHGGSVSADSEGAGKGAEFVVRLSVLKDSFSAGVPA